MRFITFVFLLILNFTLAEEFNPLKCIKSEHEFTNIAVPRDFHMGSLDAKVTIIDYSSYACHHCAEFFQNSLLNIKNKYIDTGKVVLIMRDFPLDEISLRGAMLLRCSEKSKNNQIDFLDVINQLFNISTAARSKNDFDENLYKLAENKLNFSRQQVDECLSNKSICDEVLSMKLFALKSPEINISGTPTIFINGNKHVGGLKLADLEVLIDSYLLQSK